MPVPQIVGKDRSPERRRFPGPRVPPNLFAIALGVAGLAEAWHAAVPFAAGTQELLQAPQTWGLDVVSKQLPEQFVRPGPQPLASGAKHWAGGTHAPRCVAVRPAQPASDAGKQKLNPP